jgi:Phage integrase, N-terminal SAM-like domain
MMGYWPSQKQGNLIFLSCPDVFTKGMLRILKMAKASYQAKEFLTPNPKAPLREQVREVLRFHHYSLRTEKAYWQWVRRYRAFHRSPDHSGRQKGWRHPREMGALEVAGRGPGAVSERGPV